MNFRLAGFYCLARRSILMRVGLSMAASLATSLLAASLLAASLTFMSDLSLMSVDAQVVIDRGNLGKQWCWDATRQAILSGATIETQTIDREVLRQSQALKLTEGQMIYSWVYELARAEQEDLRVMKASHWGHRKTQIVPRSQLKAVAGVNPNRREYLAPEAAQAWQRMQMAARADGVRLAIADSYRTYADQAQLFEHQIQRRGNEALAAQWSAPPGYSEHHTGYAIDLAGTDVSGLLHPVRDQAIADWVRTHGPSYGWEISFKEGNASGIRPEPWHLRYVSVRSQLLLGLPTPIMVDLTQIATPLRQFVTATQTNFQAVDQSLGVSPLWQVAMRASQFQASFQQCFDVNY